MQSKIIKSVDLFNEFPRVYKIADYNKEVLANMILSGNIANFFLIESYGYPLDEVTNPEFKDMSINNYKTMCADELHNVILGLKQEAENDLYDLTDTFTQKWLSFFKNKDIVNGLKSKIDNMNTYLNDKQSIIKNIAFKHEYLSETLKIPFYRFHTGQKIYLVIQDPQHFMKVQEGIIKKVKPLNTSSDSNTLCDIEFEYDILVDNTITSIGYQSLRSFDGSKCMVNYNYTIFVDLEDAKTNCRKVLNGLKSQIDQQISIIDDFKGSNHVLPSS